MRFCKGFSRALIMPGLFVARVQANPSCYPTFQAETNYKAGTTVSASIVEHTTDGTRPVAITRTYNYRCVDNPDSLYCQQGWAFGPASLNGHVAWEKLDECYNETALYPNTWSAGDGCPARYDSYNDGIGSYSSHYDPGDLVSVPIPASEREYGENKVYRCKDQGFEELVHHRAQTSQCGQVGFEPDGLYGHLVWEFLGNCTGALPSPELVLGYWGRRCPAPWVEMDWSPAHLPDNTYEYSRYASYYEPGDLVSEGNVVYQCRRFPDYRHCGQAGYQPPKSPATPGAWKDAWAPQGICDPNNSTMAPTHSPSVYGGSCDYLKCTSVSTDCQCDSSDCPNPHGLPVGCTKTVQSCESKAVEPYSPTRTYDYGDVVRVGLDRYVCLGYPFGLWCNNPSYQPRLMDGIWSDAWRRDGVCPSGPTQSPTPPAPSTPSPSRGPSQSPSAMPSTSPSKSPSQSPTSKIEPIPPPPSSQSPTTKAPSTSPSHSHSTPRPSRILLTQSPSKSPSQSPSTKAPSVAPSTPSPSRGPSQSPSAMPSTSPSKSPSQSPTNKIEPIPPAPGPILLPQSPSTAPSTSPSRGPSQSPSTKAPSTSPSQSPSTKAPSTSPSQSPSTKAPSTSPSQSPSTKAPSSSPSQSPSTKAPSTSPSQTPSCSNEVDFDICFALDMSGSVCSKNSPIACSDSCSPSDECRDFTVPRDTCCENFRSIQDFTIDMVTALDSFNGDKSYSIVQFASSGSLVQSSGDKDSTIDSVNGLMYTGGQTNHAEAIGRCQDALSGTPDHKKFMILITDGVSTLPQPGPINSTFASADLAKGDDINIIPVFITTTSSGGLQVMSTISSDGKVFNVTDFGSLEAIEQELIEQVTAPSTSHCSSPSQSPTPPAPSTPSPSRGPSQSPSAMPSASPSKSPSQSPTNKIEPIPSQSPSTKAPSTSPSQSPSTKAPSTSPSQSPSTKAPSTSPSQSPTTKSPSTSPSQSPSTKAPSTSPSQSPSTKAPSTSPSQSPSAKAPSTSPSQSPSTKAPSTSPSQSPSTKASSTSPSQSPSTKAPSTSPSQSPTPGPRSNWDICTTYVCSGVLSSSPFRIVNLDNYICPHGERGEGCSGFVTYLTYDQHGNLTLADWTDNTKYIYNADKTLTVQGGPGGHEDGKCLWSDGGTYPRFKDCPASGTAPDADLVWDYFRVGTLYNGQLRSNGGTKCLVTLQGTDDLAMRDCPPT